MEKLHKTFTWIWDLGSILGLGMNNMDDIYDWCTVCVELMITWLDYEAWMLCACESMSAWRWTLKSECLRVTLGMGEIWQNPTGHAPPGGIWTAARRPVRAVASWVALWLAFLGLWLEGLCSWNGIVVKGRIKLNMWWN